MNPARKHLPPLIFSLLILLAQLPQTAAQGDNRVALVVDYGDGAVQTSCISFSEESITGYEALQRSNLPLTVGIGAAGVNICAIGDVGCAAEPCLCQCTGEADCVLWSYWRGLAGSWDFVGLVEADNYVVQDGAVEGWRWGQVSGQNVAPPPLLAFDAICAVPETPTPIPIVLQPTATATTSGNRPNPTATVTQTAVSTPLPTTTATLLSANTPTMLPTGTPTALISEDVTTPSPTVDLSVPGTPRPTVTAWVPTRAAEATVATEIALPATPTSDIVIVALPTLTADLPVVVETAVLPPTPISQPIALAANIQPIAESTDAAPAAARIGALVEPNETQNSVPVVRKTAVFLAPYIVVGFLLLALGFIWWRRSHKSNRRRPG